MKLILATLALFASTTFAGDRSCEVLYTYGSTPAEAEQNCVAQYKGELGQCESLDTMDKKVACQCLTNCESQEFGILSIVKQAVRPNLTCTCHSLNRSNPSEEAACNALMVGTTCGRVGNLICIPECI